MKSHSTVSNRLKWGGDGLAPPSRPSTPRVLKKSPSPFPKRRANLPRLLFNLLLRTRKSRLVRSIIAILVVVVIAISFRTAIQGDGEERRYGWSLPLVIVRHGPSPTARHTVVNKSIAPTVEVDELDQVPVDLYGFGAGELPDELLPLPDDDDFDSRLYLTNGLVEADLNRRHPIYDLIERSQAAWEAKLSRQSKTLAEAVAEYQKRYDKRPPRGFDKWWDYVQKHNVQLPDEYDQIMKDILPFHGYKPSDLRILQANLRGKEGTFTISSSPSTGQIILSRPPAGDKSRAIGQLQLLRGYEVANASHDGGVEKDLIAATGAWEATFSVHDGPQDFLDWLFLEDLLAHVDYGTHMPLSEQPEMIYRGWGSACPYSSTLRLSYPDAPAMPIADPAPKTFIYDHRRAMSPCLNPDLVHTVGFLSSHKRGPGPQAQKKFIFSMCKTEGLHGDLLGVPTEQIRDSDERDAVPWADKLDDRMAWRGSTTGVSNTPQLPWQMSQRIRLVTDLNANTGNRSVLAPTGPRSSVGEPHLMKTAYLNPSLMDVGFVGRPVQCHDGVCEEMLRMFDWRGTFSWDKLSRYKFLIDIDGNGWSGRFKRLLSLNSVVLKATIFPEWYMDRIQPWVHYVPIKMDLTDLYDVLIFFRGGVTRGDKAHDVLAETIAAQGKRWQAEFWRKEDMIAYTYRLFLEYGRLVSDDRDKMNYVLPAGEL